MAASLAAEPASVQQRVVLAAIAAAICAAGVVGMNAAPWTLPRIPAFLPAVTAAVTFAYLITGFLVIAQFRIMGTASFALLGAAFLFTGFIVMAQFLSVPAIVAPDGLFGGGAHAAHALWLYWHGGFAVFIFAYAAVKIAVDKGNQPDMRPVLSTELTVILPLVLVIIAIAAAEFPPSNPYPANNISHAGGFICALTLSALAAVLYASAGRTVADLAVGLATLASLFDVLLSLGAAPYSAGWYGGRVFALVSACSILIVFLVEVTNLYARTMALNAGLEKIAHLDGLTGLPNRRQFDERLAAEWRGAIRRRSSIGMLMIDVDFFKRYNDRYGHMQGDEALKRVAGAIRDTAKRTTDIAARFGGEEFAVILPDTEFAAAAQLAESIRLAVRQLALPHEDNPPAGVVTVSIGVTATVPSARWAAEILTKTADAALYLAKNRGRDQIAAEEIAAESISNPDLSIVSMPQVDGS